MKRKLIVISGAAASGKTTLGIRLQHDLGIPMLTKDDIKELLFETLPQSDRDWSRVQGKMAMAMMYAGTRTLLDEGLPVLIEAVFNREKAQKDTIALGDELDVAEVHCVVSEQVRQQRWRHRAHSSRHPGQLDGSTAPLDAYAQKPIFPEKAVTIDTGQPIELYESSCRGIVDNLKLWLKER